MFEKETDEIIEIILFRTVTRKPSISLKSILAADVPSLVKAFFRADVDALLLEEQRRNRASSRFNYNHPEVKSLEEQINSILILHYEYPLEVYRHRVADAIHLLFNYLVRPQWTIAESVFEKAESVSTTALAGLLRYFDAYEYLKDLLLRYLMEKNIPSVNRETFRLLLWKLDAEYLRRKNGDQVARALTPLYDLVNFLHVGSDPSVPTIALEKHFEDKGLLTVTTMLEGVLAQGKESLTLRELADLLEDVRRTAGVFLAENMDHNIEQKRESILSSSPADHAKSGLTPHRVLVFDEADERRFIKRIFKHDMNAFTAAIGSLQAMTSWKEASRAIDEILISHVIDPYSSDAVRFIEVLHAQFHQEQE